MAVSMLINHKWRSASGPLLYRDPFTLMLQVYASDSGPKTKSANGDFMETAEQQNSNQTSNKPISSGFFSKMIRFLKLGNKDDMTLQQRLDTFIKNTSFYRVKTDTRYRSTSHQLFQSKSPKKFKSHYDYRKFINFNEDSGQWIRILNLSQWAQNQIFLTDDQINQLSSYCICLLVLDLSHQAQLSDSAIQSLAFSNCLQNLVELNLSFIPNLTDNSVTHILRNLKNLQCLNLNGCTQLSDLTFLTLARHSHGLRKLRISQTSITDIGLQAIAKDLHSIQYVDLNQCNLISDKGICEFARSNPHLKWIDLTRSSKSIVQNNITDLSIIEIIDSCQDLELLDISYCQFVSDKSLIHLAENCIHLKSLSLKGLNRITAQSIFALGELRKNHHKLVWLQIYNCKNITSSVIDRMINMLNDGWRKGPYDKTVHSAVMGSNW